MKEIVRVAGVSKAREDSKGAVSGIAVGRVLGRVAVAAPYPVPQADIASGAMLAQPRGYTLGTVARAVDALLARNFLFKELPSSKRRGRSIVPYRLDDSHWRIAGVHVACRNGVVTQLTAGLYGLDMSLRSTRSATPNLGRNSPADLAEEVAELVSDLCEDVPVDSALLGVGVEVSEQVHLDQMWSQGRFLPLGEDISALLSPRLSGIAPDGVAVVVENDANARAIERSYLFGHPTFALVAVFEYGVGAALVSRNRLVRGVSGGAGEIGHVAVEFDYDEGTYGFDSACNCGQRGHVDALATPDRIRQALNGKPLREAAATPYFIDSRTITADAAAFRRSGRALGRGLSTLLTLTNPGRLHLLLPKEMGSARNGTAGAAYVEAVETEVSSAHGPSAADARSAGGRLAIEIVDLDDLQATGCRAAAWTVLHAFIEHAREREDCVPTTFARPADDYDPSRRGERAPLR